jgi:type II secretory ATPase GspE/PulE/Tfp pilus assembly ATPase PilB-like protein
VRVLADTKTLATKEDLDKKFLNLIDLKVEDALGKVCKPVPTTDIPTGFKGRKAIFEMMLMNAEIRELTFNKSQASEIRKAALAAGMKGLVVDGRTKVLNGVTTPEEIARVSQSDGGH